MTELIRALFLSWLTDKNTYLRRGKRNERSNEKITESELGRGVRKKRHVDRNVGPQTD